MNTMIEEEIWKVYKETNSRRYGKRVYEVSNFGRVKLNNKIIECNKDSNGYYAIACVNVHRMVAELFIPNPDNKPCVDHINTIKIDNRVENLRWVTYKENNSNKLTVKHNKENHKGFTNKHHSKISREKISKSLKGKYEGNNNPMYDKPSPSKGKHRVYREDGSYYYTF